MKRLLSSVVLLLFLTAPHVLSQSADDISVSEYGRYRYAGRDWVILVVPPAASVS
ncbi:MAG: hypothetical protein ACXW18_05045 [Pyrinomonadaceae bacterium]